MDVAGIVVGFDSLLNGSAAVLAHAVVIVESRVVLMQLAVGYGTIELSFGIVAVGSHSVAVSAYSLAEFLFLQFLVALACGHATSLGHLVLYLVRDRNLLSLVLA